MSYSPLPVIGLPTIRGECDALNHRSAAVMRTAGMTPIEASAEGDLRFHADRSWRPPTGQHKSA